MTKVTSPSDILKQANIGEWKQKQKQKIKE